ncbi:hypothetical protein IWX50DRAFT_642771 [Phyllosticta citricarpa]
MADPSEIAYAVAFLCEERALWINGEYLSANRWIVCRLNRIAIKTISLSGPK